MALTVLITDIREGIQTELAPIEFHMQMLGILIRRDLPPHAANQQINRIAPERKTKVAFAKCTAGRKINIEIRQFLGKTPRVLRVS